MLCQFGKLNMNNFLDFETFNNQCNIIKKSIYLTQDRENIIDNILTGKKYISFELIIDQESLTFKIKMTNIIKNISIFDINMIYLPLKKRHSIKDHFEQHKELSFLNNSFDSFDTININIIETINNLKNLKINKINVPLPEWFFRSSQLKRTNYFLICSFLKDNNKIKFNTKNIVLLNFSYSRGCYFLEKFSYNEMYDSLENVFYIEDINADIREIYPFSELCFNADEIIELKNNRYFLNNEKTIEKISYINNLKNF